MPVIGFLNATSPDTVRGSTARISPGPEGTGYIEGENVAIEYRWAENQIDRLPALAADLARRQVAVIVTVAGRRLRGQGGDHDDSYCLRHCRRPGHGRPRRQPRPAGRQPDRYQFFQYRGWRKAAGAAARAGARSRSCGCARQSDRCPRYRDHVERHGTGCARHGAANPGAQRQHQPRDQCGLLNIRAQRSPTPSSSRADPFFTSRRIQLAILAARHAVPATFASREYAEAGGLMSYGTNFADTYRQVGVYTGRILKGAKPADLPVVQSTKFELVINAETARALGLDSAADAARPRRRGDRMKRGASSSRCSAARRRRGRWRRARR